jgi:hypothetical protein
MFWGEGHAELYSTLTILVQLVQPVYLLYWNATLYASEAGVAQSV